MKTSAYFKFMFMPAVLVLMVAGSPLLAGLFEIAPNQPPIVQVGVSPTFLPTYMSVLVWGSVTDDGLPNPPGMVTATWSKISGPGTATFYPDCSVPDPLVQFDQPGNYVLRLTAFDGELTAYDELTYGASIPPLIAEIAPPQPPFPTVCDQLAITVFGQWGDSCIPEESQVTVVGNHIYFDVIHYTWLDTGCATVMSDWSLTESVGPLLPGHYTVHAVLYQYVEGEDVTLPLLIAEREFDVVDIRLVGDFNQDCWVTWADFSIFASHWLESECDEPDWCDAADMSHNGEVSWADFAIFAEHWLKCAGVGCVPVMAWHVEPECALGIAQGQDEFSTVEDLDETRFTVTVEEQYIHFEDMIEANCCNDGIELEMTVDGNLITVYEIEYLTMPCTCLCDFPAAATLGPFTAGIYTVEVIDPYGVPLGTVQVTIGKSQ